MSANGIVRPCSCPASQRGWQRGAEDLTRQRIRATFCCCAPRRERPRSRRAAEQRHDLAPLHPRNHSITSSSPPFTEWDVMEYVACSFRLDAGGLDHLGPFLGFVDDELTEVGRRAGKRRSP